MHSRAGQPNQDALAWRPPSGSGDFLVVAVADGHGGSKGFRSEIGARLAVGVAMDVLVERVADLHPQASDERPGSLWPLLREITGWWATAARADLAERPFTERELQPLEEQAMGGTDELERNPLLAYGSTLMTVAVTPTAVYYLQLGDGHILTVWPGGEVRRPIPVDQRLLGNSLCLDKAWREFRVAADLAGHLPQMVLVCTDGYANSFLDEGAFEQVGTDLLPIVERQGLDAVAKSLEGWLTETTQLGSGDDATLAVISLPPTSALASRSAPAAARSAPAAARPAPAPTVPTPSRPVPAEGSPPGERFSQRRVSRRRQFRLPWPKKRQSGTGQRSEARGSQHAEWWLESPVEAPGDRTSFTLAYPNTVAPTVWYSLYTYVHLSRLQKIVNERSADQFRRLNQRPSISTSESPAPLPRGTILRVRPQVSGLSFNPSVQELEWLEDLHEVLFRFRAPFDWAGQALLGSVDIYTGSLLIAQVPLAVHVGTTGQPDRSEFVRTTAEIFSKVFASYSHDDRRIVMACAAAYKALGIDMLTDNHSLRSGQDWKAALRQLMEDSDAFQLFWSKASSASREVTEEWQQALQLRDRKGAQFIRPVYWENPWPPPPTELQHIHFAPLDDRELSHVKSSMAGDPGAMTSTSVWNPVASTAFEVDAEPANPTRNFCTTCGTRLRPEDRFCPQCGMIAP
jgi:hypothetical protein